VTPGRWVAIVILFVVFLAGGYTTWRLAEDRKAHIAREDALRIELFAMRKTIDAFYKANGRYPRTLEEAFANRIPVDPITHSSKTWRVTMEDVVQPNIDFTTSTSTSKTESYIIDVHSGAGAPYSEW
jgi:general secretion pathway protein G